MITGLHLLVLFCRDTEASCAWYERAGFEYLRGYDGMHWFKFGNAEIMLHPGGNGSVPGGPILDRRQLPSVEAGCHRLTRVQWPTIDP